MNRSFLFASLSLFAAFALPACAADPASDAETTESELTNVFAAEFSEGSREASAILAVANDRELSQEDYDRNVGEGGVGLSHEMARSLVVRRGRSDRYASLAELNALPGATLTQFQRLFGYAKKAGTRYGWTTSIPARLTIGERVGFACTVTYFNPASQRTEVRNEHGSFFAKLDGDTLVLSDQQVSLVQSSAWWAPSEGSFTLVGGVATQRMSSGTYGEPPVYEQTLRVRDDAFTLSFVRTRGTPSRCSGSLSASR